MNIKQGDARLLERLTALLCHLGLPTTAPDYDPVTIWEAMQSDKKRRGRALRWILPRALGDVLVTDDVSPADVLTVLESMCDA
jgi:3-dehydroquinate synthase